MSRNKIMGWMHGRRNPMKFVEAADLIGHSLSKSMIDTSRAYEKMSGTKTAVTFHVGVLTPEIMVTQIHVSVGWGL
jgi:hypothetical protein